MLKVRRIDFMPSIKKLEEFFSAQAFSGEIDKINWTNFPYKPRVNFKIAHNGSEIYLQYKVEEKYIRAKYLNDNENVWTDSCVELFISPVNDGSYYNIEFNCIGTNLVGFGYEKANRERAKSDITSGITRLSSLGNMSIEQQEGDFSWLLTLIIPVEVFFKHRLKSLSGLSAKANFYKCGDELKEAHYLSWMPITFNRPNFHLPEFFGDIYFE